MESKKVLLINAGFRTFGDLNLPLGIITIAKPLLEHGYEPVLIDARVDDYKGLDFGDFICMGISTMSGYILGSAIEIARYARKKNPNLPIIWGGCHPTIDPEQTIKSKYADIVVVGEGEEPLLGIAEALKHGKSIDNIPGILFKRDGKIIRNPPTKPQKYDSVNHLPYELMLAA